MKFLYWNLNKKSLYNLIYQIANQHDIDVMLFSEMDFDLPKLLQALNPGESGIYRYISRPFEDPIIISRLGDEFFTMHFDTSGISVFQLNPIIVPDILIVVVHLKSKLYLKTEDQPFYCQELASIIEEYETKIGHKRTVVVGDFNMNPFEQGIIVSNGLHAIMDRSIALKESRKVSGKDYYFFYNPMWRHFGDYPEGAKGTYYYNSSNPVNYYWNIFDQVLIRPQLIKYFVDSDLQILTKAGDIKLLSPAGLPDKINASDHLPIIFNLNLISGGE